MPSMADPYAKIRWAGEHLKILKPEITSFSTTPTKAYTVTCDSDVEKQRYIIRTRLHDIPHKICLIAADAIYNMRAALDQTVWALASITGPPGYTQFPIVEALTRDSFKRFADNLFGVPDEAFCEIKALQPYHEGDAFKGHPLWRLNEICNLDKHRRIPAHGTALHGTISGVGTKDVIYETTDDCHIVSVPLAMKEKVQFRPAGSVEVSFGGDKSNITETFETIVEIHKFVAQEVLPRFDRFFA